MPDLKYPTMKKRNPGLVLFFLLLALSYFPLFLNLDSLPMHTWDEARVGGSALEMYKNGNGLVIYFDGKVDNWSVKPPLLIWIQVFFLKLLGISELALRLPSALAGLFTTLSLYLFSWKVLKKPLAGFAAGLALLTTPGYVAQHVTRTGDYDALLSLWILLYALVFFITLESSKEKIRNGGLLLTGLLVGLAVLTKGVAGLFMLPPMLIYTLTQKSGRRIFRNKFTYGGMGLGILIIFTYYLAREWAAQPYLELVWQEELGGRFLVKKHIAHSHDLYFYFINLARKTFIPWVYLLPLGILAAWKEKGAGGRFIIYASGLSLFLLLLLSASQTKTIWYVAPVYPFLALITSLGITWSLNQISRFSPMHQGTLKAILCIMICFLPYYHAVKRSLNPQNENPKNQYAPFIRQLLPRDGYYLSDGSYNGHMYFYEKFFTMKGINLKVHYLGILEKGFDVMICGDPSIDFLKRNYDFEVLASYKNHCILVRIK